MSLAGEYELDGELLVVHDLGQTVEVGEEEMGAFVCCEAASKADDEGIGIDAVNDVHHCRRIALIGEPLFFEVAANEVDEFVFELDAHVPDFFIGDVEDAFPCLGVVLMLEYLWAELVHVEVFPLACGPCGHVDAICDISYMAFFPAVAFPDASEHLFRHFAVEPRYAVCFLACVEREYTHGEAFVSVGVLAAHVHEVVPADAEFGRVFAHVFAEESFVEVVVTCRYGSVDGVEA